MRATLLIFTFWISTQRRPQNCCFGDEEFQGCLPPICFGESGASELSFKDAYSTIFDLSPMISFTQEDSLVDMETCRTVRKMEKNHYMFPLTCVANIFLHWWTLVQRRDSSNFHWLRSWVFGIKERRAFTRSAMSMVWWDLFWELYHWRSLCKCAKFLF